MGQTTMALFTRVEPGEPHETPWVVPMMLKPMCVHALRVNHMVWYNHMSVQCMQYNHAVQCIQYTACSTGSTGSTGITMHAVQCMQYRQHRQHIRAGLLLCCHTSRQVWYPTNNTPHPSAPAHTQILPNPFSPACTSPVGIFHTPCPLRGLFAS